jgi:hypothetical protein
VDIRAKISYCLLALLLALSLAAPLPLAWAWTINDGQIANVTTNPADAWTRGTSVQIKWEWPDHANLPADVLLMKDGQTVAAIATNLPALAATWTVPSSLGAGAYTVRVQSQANPTWNYATKAVTVHLSSVKSTIVSGGPSQGPDATVNKPKGVLLPGDGQIANVTTTPGELRTGTAVTIKWEWPDHANAPTTVTAWKDNQKVADIATATTAGSATWTVPYTFPPGPYTIKVQSAGNPNNQATKAVQVANSTITVTSPAAGNILSPGAKITVAWTYQGNPGPVWIGRKSLNSSLGPLLIADNVPCGSNGSGQYSVDIPGFSEQGSYKLVVTSKANGAITGESPGLALYSTPISVMWPHEGDVFQKGQSVSVAFTVKRPAGSIGSPGSVDIYLYKHSTISIPFGGPPPEQVLLGSSAASDGTNSCSVNLPADKVGTYHIKVQVKGADVFSSGVSGLFTIK